VSSSKTKTKTKTKNNQVYQHATIGREITAHGIRGGKERRVRTHCGDEAAQCLVSTDSFSVVDTDKRRRCRIDRGDCAKPSCVCFFKKNLKVRNLPEQQKSQIQNQIQQQQHSCIGIGKTPHVQLATSPRAAVPSPAASREEIPAGNSGEEPENAGCAVLRI
jgi:hypothetical protein